MFFWYILFIYLGNFGEYIIFIRECFIIGEDMFIYVLYFNV